MRRYIVGGIAAIGLFGAAPVAAPAAPPADTPSIVTKSCSTGWKHAIINGAHKCLRRGQFCARAADRQYHRYRFHCHRYDSGVDRYRLS